MHLPTLLKPAATAAFGLWLATNAAAHDTWFAVAPSRAGGEAVLALGTGNQFPRQEFGIAAAHVEEHGCRTRNGEAVALDPLREGPTALLLRTASKGRAADAALSCWAQLVTYDIEIEPARIPVYFEDINATQAVRDAWAGMQARGLPWKERYTKHARVELASTAPAGPLPAPVKMGMDALLESAEPTLRAGDPLSFQVLLDGAPLPAFAVELRSDQSPDGVWLQTDTQGRVRFTPPRAGRWVLRGTDLHVSKRVPDTWESRFITLAFDVSASPTTKSAAP